MHNIADLTINALLFIFIVIPKNCIVVFCMYLCKPYAVKL